MRQSVAPGERRWLIPVKVRPDISAALAASRPEETILDIADPEIIRPLVSNHCYVVAASIIAAIDQDAAHAGFAHLAKRDFLGPLHSP